MSNWFLEYIEMDFGEKNTVDVHISDFNLRKVKKLKTSPLRWVELDGKVAPGSGEGTLIIGKYSFQVTYAWGGRHVDSDYRRRTSYTVRLEGKGIKNKFKKIKDQIITDESGATKYRVSYKDYMTERNLDTVSKFRASMKKSAKMFLEGKDFDGKDWSEKIKKHFTPEAIEAAVEKHRQEMKDPSSTVEMTYHLKNIETDML